MSFDFLFVESGRQLIGSLEYALIDSGTHVSTLSTITMATIYTNEQTIIQDTSSQHISLFASTC